MLSLTDLKLGTKIVIDGNPYAVTFAEHSKQGRGGAVMRTKLKNLISGNCLDKTFQGADKIEEAQLSHKSTQFLYADGENAHFMDNTDFEQFTLPADQISDQIKFLAENSPIEILYFDNKPISIDLPIKMTFEVVESPPGVRGNSAGTVTKMATINSGAQIAD